MGRKFVAALMAAVALVPGLSVAQERGSGRQPGSLGQYQRGIGGGGWQRSAPNARAPERQAQAGAERNWRRSSAEGGRPERQSQGGAARTWQRSTVIEGRAPQRQPQIGGERTVQRSTTQVRNGWTQRGNPAGTAAGREFQQERRGERRDFRTERQADRQALTAGAVNREAFRTDRARDIDAFRRDRTRDRGELTRERRNEAQRSWARSGADWNDQARWDSRRSDWGDQRRWSDRNSRGGWNRDWRRDSRYDWARWRTTNRNAFHLPRYYAPYGWNQGYRRFSAGVVLSSVLFAQNYWINDPWAYRLPVMDEGFRWVRYYNDALLVDVYSGEVVDVIHDMFW